MRMRPATIVFPRTKLVRRGERLIVYDRQGRIVLAATMFLLHLLTYGRSPKTVLQYGGQIVSVLRVLEVSSIALFEVSEDTLLLLQAHALTVRGAKVRSWKNVLSVFLRMLVFAESQGLCHGMIGTNREGSRDFRISLMSEEGVKHELLKQRGEKKDVPDLPADGEFALVEAEMTSAKSWVLRKQRHAMIALLHGGPLRRSELTTFGKADIPSAAEFRCLLEKLQKEGKPPVMEITFWRAKKQRDRRRRAYMSVSLVRQLIEFRDEIRPRLLKEGLDPPELFVSSKSGVGYLPQSITNLVKAAAKVAALKNGEHLKKIRPHFYRHRSATTKIKEYLAAGMDVVKACLLVQAEMDVTFDVMCHYLHIAQEEMNVESPEFMKASTAFDNLAKLRWSLSDVLGGDFRQRRR
ncbi:hypothetical protein ASG03_19560 [Rhizobium sp. Leaf341]|nr:hypothetical protein ASG03_19560 [Rhizobium sp. Leaf341]